MNDATDAIAMLENELDRKDAQVRELLIKLTMLCSSESDQCKIRVMNGAMGRAMDRAMDGNSDG